MDAGQHHHLHHHHRHQIQQQQEQILLSNTTSSVNIQGGDTSGGGDRFPQWSIEETRDFVMIRAELDPTFMETKRNKVLWQLIATKMKDKGYHRSAEQCKCKWKNLVTRYKGCETMEPEGLMKQQFPFYNELQTIFAARMQRMLWNEAEGSGAGGGGGGGGGSNKKKNAQLSSDDDEEDESDEDGDHKGTTSVKKKRKTSKHTVGSTSINNTTNVGSDVNKNMKEMLEDFMKQQIQMEMQWMKAYEAREEERRIREMEWRQKMEALEKERMMMERRWREREEQTRVREEARAEKRDALINALLNKLRREDNIS